VILDTQNGSISVAAHPRDSYGAYYGLASDTFTGRGVTPESSLGLAAVYGAVSLISNTCGTMPLEIINEKAAGGRQVVRGGQLAPMLRYQPNADMSGAALWTLVYAHLLLRGNAYLAKVRDERGIVTELYPVNPQNVTPYRGGPNGEKLFRVRIYSGNESMERDFTSRDILHIMGPSFDNGILGASPIAVLRNRIGVQLAQSEFQGRFYQQGMSIRGVLSTPEKLTPEGAGRIKAQWDVAYGGLDNSHMVAVLHSGTQFQQVSLSPEDAQFIETMRWGHTEVATAFSIPASRLNGEGTSLTYANQGQDDLFYYKQGCYPRIRMVEDALNMDTDLFGFQSSWVPRFNADNVLRSDIETRFKVYATGRAIGVLSANDVREYEDLPRISGGDDYTPTGAKAAGEAQVRALELAEQRRVHVRNELVMPEQPAPVVNVSPPEVRVDAPVVTVEPATVRAGDVIVHVPEQPAPVVTVEPPVVNVAAPDVRVEPPVVNVAAPEVRVDVAAPNVQVDAPVTVEGSGDRSVSFQRDANGFIVGAEIDEA
jgi:HK97 family phage portal protein